MTQEVQEITEGVSFQTNKKICRTPPSCILQVIALGSEVLSEQALQMRGRSDLNPGCNHLQYFLKDNVCRKKARTIWSMRCFSFEIHLPIMASGACQKIHTAVVK